MGLQFGEIKVPKQEHLSDAILYKNETKIIITID
jgi:hypothetical protein